MITAYSLLPLSLSPINGVLHVREKDKEPLTWELYVGESKEFNQFGTGNEELNKLPNFPITHKLNESSVRKSFFAPLRPFDRILAQMPNACLRGWTNSSAIS